MVPICLSCCEPHPSPVGTERCTAAQRTARIASMARRREQQSWCFVILFRQSLDRTAAPLFHQAKWQWKQQQPLVQFAHKLPAPLAPRRHQQLRSPSTVSCEGSEPALQPHRWSLKGNNASGAALLPSPSADTRCPTLHPTLLICALEQGEGLGCSQVPTNTDC